VCARLQAEQAGRGEAAGSVPPPAVFIFHRSGARDIVVDFMQRCSGEEQFERAPVVCDPKIRREVLESDAVKGSPVLAATVAMTGSSSLFARQSDDLIPHLFVVTESKIAYFSMNWRSWSTPKASDVFFDDVDEFVPEELRDCDAPGAAEASAATAARPPGNGEDAGAPGLQHHKERLAEPPIVGNTAPPTAAKPTAVAKKEARSGLRACMFGGRAAEAASSVGQAVEQKVLTFVKALPLPPKEMVFENSARPELTIKGDSTVLIRFYDDAGRESWRRALAYALSKAGGPWTRR